jgi:predicted phage terminase large subunit-like protein
MVFRTLDPRAQFKPNWHIDAITYRLEQAHAGLEKRLIINVPPRSLKSSLTSVAFPAFILGHHPGARLICVSYAQPLATKLSRDFRRILDSEWYRRIFPSTVVSKDTEEILETTLGGFRLSTSIGAVVTGFGAGTIILDDPMKPDEAPSQAARERVIRYYRETLFTRLDSKIDGAIILVMQRLHEDDLAGYLLRDSDWTHLNLPAIAIAEEEVVLGRGLTHIRRVGDVLHPEREPLSALNELRRNLGSAAFEAQYQQSPVPADGLRVKRDWLMFYDIPLDRSGLRVAQSWDTALKGDPRADYSVCTTWAERNGQHYLLDVYRQQLDFPDLIKAVVSLHRRYKPDAVLIEEQGSGISLIQTLRAEHAIWPIGRRSKDDKETRLTTVTPMFEGGQVFLPVDAPWIPALLHELFGFPSGRYDDQVDSISQYLAWARDRSSNVFEADFEHDECPTMEEIANAMLHSRRF